MTTTHTSSQTISTPAVSTPPVSTPATPTHTIETWRPTRFEQFFNFPNTVLKRLLREEQHMNQPAVSLYLGDMAAGKTSAMRVRMMYCLCEKIAKISPDAWETNPVPPCGQCGGCKSAARNEEGSWKNGCAEINGAENNDVLGHLDYALEQSRLAKPFGATHRKPIICIDELHHMSFAGQAAILKQIEDKPRIQFIFGAQGLSSTDIDPSLFDRCRSRYKFPALTAVELKNGLMQVADFHKLTLSPPLIQWLLIRSGNKIRPLLGDLYALSTYGTTIDLETAKAALGDDSEDDTEDLSG